MDDDKLKELFSGFEPEISSSAQFMAGMQRSLDAFEFVKRQNVALRKRNRRAVAIAAVCGFAVGVIQTILFPLIVEWISGLNLSLPDIQPDLLAVSHHLVLWIIMAAICVATTLSAYRLALTRTATGAWRGLGVGRQ